MSDLRTEAAGLVELLLERLTAAQQNLPPAGPVAGTGSAPAGENGSEPASDTGPSHIPGTEPSPGMPCPTCGHDPQQARCSGCPLCALLAMLRGERPELTARLLDSALATLHGIRGLIGDLPATDPQAAGPQTADPQTGDAQTGDAQTGDAQTTHPYPTGFRPAEPRTEPARAVERIVIR
jgi:hypothetical protein